MPLAMPRAAEPVKVDVIHPCWEVVIEYTDQRLAHIGKRLAELDIPDPEAGGEVGDVELWQIECCWPGERLAVVVDSGLDRDNWLSDNGWRVFSYARPEDEEELVQKIAEAFGKQAR